ncbi:MAG: PIN domain-containing protein [Hyphomicrobiales bacterium]|nr:PIN domain-containing protein [Hyphomicrobiales bacterium]
MILLDSNVVSEAMKPEPHPPVRDWLDAQAPETLLLSSATMAELLFGIRDLRRVVRRHHNPELVGADQLPSARPTIHRRAPFGRRRMGQHHVDLALLEQVHGLSGAGAEPNHRGIMAPNEICGDGFQKPALSRASPGEPNLIGVPSPDSCGA